VHDKQFTPKVYGLGMNENVVSLVWNDQLKSTLKPDTVSAVEKLEADIRAGKLEVPLAKL
jgi:basic membrane lipoprotein Med (substrate-binding protein (PBP1-ABC) superfamily)